MRFKFICCEVFFRMACLAAAMSKNTVEFDFTPFKSHAEPDELRAIIQGLIDDAEQSDEQYDAIILGFGLCGNATDGLRASRLRMVIPRAHDCCAIFLGSVQKYIEYFKDRPSAGFGSHGYFEREREYLKNTDYAKRLGLDKTYKQLEEEYGEADAKALWEALHPAVHDENPIYIRVEPFESMGFFEEYLDRLHEKSLDGFEEKFYKPEDVEIIEGSMRFMTKLTDGDWDEEFLVVPPGRTIRATYDLDNVFYAE